MDEDNRSRWLNTPEKRLLLANSVLERLYVMCVSDYKMYVGLSDEQKETAPLESAEYAGVAREAAQVLGFLRHSYPGLRKLSDPTVPQESED